jgi:acetylornithine deacetylase/succinyl-diaminopimelate desuccinylase-like protein
VHPLLDALDWDAVGADAVGLLAALIRFDTSNPPGTETPCAQYVADHLRTSGLEPQVLEAAPGRGNVVARLRGTGEEPPLLLGGHLDVVPAEGDGWSHPPFAAEIADGWLWGRGAVDMKNMVAMSLTVLRLLASSGATLRRDVVFAGVADEEAGCSHGSAWLVDRHAEKVRAGYALGEVGGFTLHLGGKPVYPVQVAEKGVCWIRARARGTSGHGSVPRKDNPVVRLSEFLVKVGRARLPVHASPPVERFVHELAVTQGRPASAVLPLLLRPHLSGVVLDAFIRDPGTNRAIGALLRNTVSPTVLQAGSKVNVIPAAAEAQLDGRIAVGSSAEELLAEVQRLAGPDIELEPIFTRPPSEAPVDTELFAIIRDVVGEHHAGARVVPSVTPGFTDAHHWSALGAVCYGFGPTRFEPNGPAFADLFHADNERVPVAGVKAGVRMLADTVFRFCVRGARR